MNRPQPLLHMLRNLPAMDTHDNPHFIVDTAQGLRHLPLDEALKLLTPTHTPQPQVLEPVRPEEPAPCTEHVQLKQLVEQLGVQVRDLVEEIADLRPYYQEEDLPATFQPDESVVMGLDALLGGAKDRENIAIGLYAATGLEGTGNVIVGPYAAEDTEGEFTDVTALGYMAMSGHVRDCINTTALGAYSHPTGSHQVVLGDYRTNTYTHSALQRRGDRRDMQEVEPLQLGLDFVLDVAPIQYRQDFRDAYIDWDNKPIEPEVPGPAPEVPDIDDTDPQYQPALVSYRASLAAWKRDMVRYEQEMVEYHSDLSQWIQDNKLSRVKATGELAGKRIHLGFDAKELLAYCKRQGLDLALAQNHKVGGGESVRTYAPDMLLAILWRSLQQLHTHIHDDQFVDLVASRLLQRHADVVSQTQAPAGADLPAEE